jgi:hypothetical protein
MMQKAWIHRLFANELTRRDPFPFLFALGCHFLQHQEQQKQQEQGQLGQRRTVQGNKLSSYVNM